MKISQNTPGLNTFVSFQKEKERPLSPDTRIGSIVSACVYLCLCVFVIDIVLVGAGVLACVYLGVLM